MATKRKVGNLLALAVDGERLRPLQVVGLALALAALLLVSGPLG